MHKNKLFILTIVASGVMLGLSLGFALRDSPALRILWMIALGVAVVMLWHLRDRI